MPCEQREWLLYQHRKNYIQYAFGGQVKPCPLCKSLYAEYDGCHYVQCVNLRCLQHFCWQCGQPIDSFQHFTGGTCKVGWDDIWKLSYLLRFLFYTDGCILMIITPIILPALAYFVPLIIVFLFPYYALHIIRGKMREMNRTPLEITAAVAILYPIILVTCLPLAIGSFIFILPAQATLALVVAVKNIPMVSKAFDIFYCAEMIFGCFGLDSWRTLLRDSKEARRLKEVELKQEELEKSERVEGEKGGDLEKGSSGAASSVPASQGVESSTAVVEKAKQVAQAVPIVGGIIGKLPGMK
ncbi:Uncharacterized protein Tcan_03523 [Toxocara canis]|uniref:Uncharacterized protein n=1 Tax=Toxocara canis TaxID=6265 RepID=A0A0B2V9U7_TOXCA|nr:Uncharacterized protein Tcan_03523 [Toxocara canis]